MRKGDIMRKINSTEEIYMKLLRLQIEKLYGHYNYNNIVFNSDVTFIYGLNGCGKTTILNITEAIITGQIYKLFIYDFRKIILEYAPKNNINSVQEIVIVQEDAKILITFRGKSYKIERIDIIKESRLKDRDFEKMRYYFSTYEFLSEIKKIFNYVYLPLNRSSMIYDFENDDDVYYYPRNRNFFVDDTFDEYFNKDLAMVQIEKLIENSCKKINSEISDISDKFRNNILKSSLDVNERYTDPHDLFNEIISQKANNINSISQTKTAYIKILKDLSLINKNEEIHFAEFFDSICNDISENKDKIPVTTVLKMNEVLKIKKIVSLAEETEKQKAYIRKPIEKFIETMNDFINTGEDGKEIKISSIGHVYFTTKYSENPISIQYLSSGEKQLITFFANLIFKVKSSTSGIFVVDEPELSLHLFWQKIFVEKTLEINKNIQLIFATHAPEIIGKNRDKTVKLEKKYVD